MYKVFITYSKLHASIHRFLWGVKLYICYKATLYLQHQPLQSYSPIAFIFLPCDAMLRAIYAVVVCLCMCVCVSVTLRYCIKTAKGRITQIMPHDSPETLVFWHQSSRQNSNGITPQWGGLKLATFDKKRAITRKRYKIDT